MRQKRRPQSWGGYFIAAIRPAAGRDRRCRHSDIPDGKGRARGRRGHGGQERHGWTQGT
jgi:hypothetical protein